LIAVFSQKNVVQQTFYTQLCCPQTPFQPPCKLKEIFYVPPIVGLLINKQAVIITASAKYATGMLHAKKGPTEAK
jgi:hypothetical protein